MCFLNTKYNENVSKTLKEIKRIGWIVFYHIGMQTEFIYFFLEKLDH